jgi:hypothetical protein
MLTLHWAKKGAWLVVLGLASCTSVEELPSTVDAGSTESGSDAPSEGGALLGTMECGSIPVATEACATCADDHCCSAGEACADNEACVALRSCVAACPADDEPCTDACDDANPEGTADNAVLSACRMRWCGEECFELTGAECGFEQPPASCNECAQSMCCEVGWVSNTQPSFWAYQDCVVLCDPSDGACFDACSAENPDGRDYYMTFIGCLGTHCADGCGIAATCGGFYGPACSTCVSDNCCDASLACLLDPACQKLQACVRSCGSDADCVSACEQTSPDAVDAFAALDSCLTSTCAGACP